MENWGFYPYLSTVAPWMARMPALSTDLGGPTFYRHAGSYYFIKLSHLVHFGQTLATSLFSAPSVFALALGDICSFCDNHWIFVEIWSLPFIFPKPSKGLTTPSSGAKYFMLPYRTQPQCYALGSFPTSYSSHGSWRSWLCHKNLFKFCSLAALFVRSVCQQWEH